MSLVAFSASQTALFPSTLASIKQTGRAQPPSFLKRSSARAKAAAPDRLGAAVVSPLFARRPWLQDDAAVQLGWDYGHYGVRPPLDALYALPELKQGYQAAIAVFGRRTLSLTATVQTWLALRLEALQSGREFDADEVNVRYVEQVATAFCPVTRRPLDLAANNALIARLRNDQGYAAGNLVAMSRRAYLALSVSGAVPLADLAATDCASDREVDSARDRAENGVAALPSSATMTTICAIALGRLDAADKGRLATLRSFGVPMSHAAASKLPLLVLPPNRLRVRNAIQVLQAMASRSLAVGDELYALMRAAMPGKDVRDDVDAFAAVFEEAFSASLAATTRSAALPGVAAAALHAWAIEDTWKSAAVQHGWQRLASHLDAASTERLIAKLGRRAVGFTVAIWPDDGLLPEQPAVQADRLRA
jgi:hypothetical protein